MIAEGTTSGRAKPPGEASHLSSRGAAADSSPQRELWVRAGNVCESRRGDTRFSAAPLGLAHRGSPTPGSRPGLLSSAPPVLQRLRPSSSTGRAKPPGEPPQGQLLTTRLLVGSRRSTGANSGRARHSVRALRSPTVPDAIGLRRRAEDCPPYHLRSRAEKHRTSTAGRTLKASARGLPGRSGRNRSQAIRRFPTQSSVRKRCRPEGRAPKTSPGRAVPHPFHPRDLWAVSSIPFTTSRPFVFIRG